MRAALGFLTIIGGARPLERSSLRWFPVVGMAVGGTLGLWWWAASHWWPPLLAAALVVLADLAVTGFLHLDGLADAADGLLASVPAERRLAIMAGPEIGAFGVGMIVAVLMVRTAAVVGLPGDARAVALMAGLWACSRGLMAVAVALTTPARPNGLAAVFAGGPAGSTAVIATACSLPLLVAGARWSGAVAGLVAVASGASVLVWGSRRLGGMTGDLAGAAGVVAETAGLIALAAR